jgi:peptidoglycan/xylan/chitin deacetylase (PgdA/CDA1 family)
MSFREEQRGRPARRRSRRPPVTPGRVVAVGSLLLVAVVAVVIVLRSGSSTHPAGPTPSASTSTATTGHSATSASTSRTTVSPGTASVPVLVYHVINTQPAGSSASPALYVPAVEFSSQMQALKQGGWHAVTLNQLEAYWTHGGSLGPGKPIVITFDNGYASQYANALPVLRTLGWVGVENLVVNGLPPSEGGLSDGEIRGLIAAGWELDTQGLTHTSLVTVGAGQLTDEVSTARQTLRRRYGVPVNWFSYPSGDYNAAVLAAVRAAGYLGATTVNPGWATPRQDRFRLPRLVVTGGTTPSQLLAQIASAQTTTPTPPTYTGAGTA